MIGTNKQSFYLKFLDNWYYKNDIIKTSEGIKLKVLETPHKKWYKQLLQFITFGLYKAPTEYKCKVIEE